jgi:hypothetical protein
MRTFTNLIIDLAVRLWRRITNEPAVAIGVVIVALRTAGADVDVDAAAAAARAIEGNIDALIGLIAVRQTVDGPRTRQATAREQAQDRQAVDELVHPRLDQAEDSHAD